MLRYQRMSCCLVILVVSFSCKKPKPTSLPQPETILAEELRNDFDPYFTESSTITSIVGPKSITRNILQDKSGTIWFATWEGIISYDGKEFTNHTNKEDLRRFHVFSVFEHSSGDLWFGTIGAGVYHYDGSAFTNYTTLDSLAHNNVSCFFEKKDGSLWIGTQSGISVFNDKSFSDVYASDVLDDMDINSIIEDDDGGIWIGTRGKAFIYDDKAFNEVKNNQGEAYYNVRCIINDADGGIWLGGNGGLWCYDGSKFTNYTNRFVGYIYQDKERNIWTNSEVVDKNGFWALSRYDALAINNPAMDPVTILEKEDMFFGINEDKDGGIWFGTFTGTCRYDDDNFNYFDK